jgi:hypothetical protein
MNIIKTLRDFLFFTIFLFAVSVYAQNDDQSGEDSVEVADQIDSTVTYKEVNYKAIPDSSIVENKSFSETKYEALKKDPDLNYQQAPTVGESLWSRLLSWLGKFFEALVENAVTTNWGRILVYAIGLALLVVIIMMILKVNAFKVLYSGESQSQRYQVLDENIHEMDFDKLIKDSLTAKDYRKAVRLVFLFSLKLLSDKDLVHFQSGKTNHDYVAELKDPDLKIGFNELSFYFEYAWYGNFTINAETFTKVENTFHDWRTKIR